jgi:uncharacterized protein YkwD
VLRNVHWLIGLGVLLASCAVNPVTPPAIIDLSQQTPPLASPAATELPGTDVAVTHSGLPTVSVAESSVAAPTLAGPTAVASDTVAAVPAGASSTPSLIVVANVALVPAPTATKPPVAVAVAGTNAAAPPTAVRPTALPPVVVAPPLSSDVAAAEQYAVDLINAQRTAAGVAPLTGNATLMNIANGRVADMVARGYTGHNDPVSGVALGPAQMRAAGFGGLVGENWYGSRLGPPAIADVAMKWFMTDRPHYQNILNPLYDGVGVGIAFNGQQWLFIQDFAGN